MIAASHFSQKENKSGFYNSRTRSFNGRKGDTTQTEKKGLNTETSFQNL